MRHMTIPIVSIAALGAATVTGAPCDDVIEMSEPLHRKTMVLAERNDAPTIVGARAFASYQDDPALAVRCDSLPPEKRAACLPCFSLDVMLALEAGDIKSLQALYEPGMPAESLLGFFGRDPNGAIVTAYEDFARLYLTGYALWDEYAAVGFGGERHDGKVYETLSWFFLRWNTETEQWCGTPDITLLNYPIYTVQSTDLIDAPPAGLRTIRLSVDKNSPPEKRTVRAEDVDRPDIEMDDIIVYLREERFPIDAPFLTLDPATLDDAGRRLREALATHLAWQLTDDIPDEEYLRIWAPTAQLNIRNKIRLRREHGVIKGFPGIRYPERDIPLLRIVSRVFTDHGVVWFGVTPPLPVFSSRVQVPGMPKVNAPPQPAPEPGFVVLYQLRLDDGSWVMLDSSWGALEVRVQLEDGAWVLFDPSWGIEEIRKIRVREVVRTRDQMAMRVLGDHSGIAELLTREARHALADTKEW